jgi:hypothetical protein
VINSLLAQIAGLKKQNAALTQNDGFFVGSYATSPNLFALEHPTEASWDLQKEVAFYEGLAAIPRCRGLEVQFDGSAKMHAFDEDWFLRHAVRPEWNAVLTCVGGTMANIGTSATFGLASDDAKGREAALAFARKAQEAVVRWNNRAEGAGKVIAVEIHSAPNVTKPGASSSADAFTESLVELASWDWQGATLVVEHCDAPAADPSAQPASKGFLTLADEIKAVKACNAKINGGIGIGINWARSVLETRNTDTPVAHIKEAAEAGLLKGLMFSGCTGEANAYGPWKDCHMPHAPTRGANFAAEGSLMTAAKISEAINAARSTNLLYSGCKITALHDPTGSDVALRVGLNKDLLAILSSMA